MRSSRNVRLLAAQVVINGSEHSFFEPDPFWEWVLFDGVSFLCDWLDFQSYAGGEYGLRSFHVVTRGHVVLPLELAGRSGDYLSAEVLSAGVWRWHAPRLFVVRARPAPPLLTVVR